MHFYRTFSSLSLAILVGAFCVGDRAQANPIVDQLNAGTDGSISFGGDYLWQSFRQSADNISGAGILLYSNSSNGPRVLSIGVFSANPSISPGSLLATGTVSATVGNWADVFWSPVNLTQGATYYLGVLPISPLNSDFQLYFTINDKYANGLMGFGSSPVAPGYDLTFRTYSSVPENAATLTLVGLALIGFVVVRRRVSS